MTFLKAKTVNKAEPKNQGDRQDEDDWSYWPLTSTTRLNNGIASPSVFAPDPEPVTQSLEEE